MTANLNFITISVNHDETNLVLAMQGAWGPRPRLHIHAAPYARNAGELAPTLQFAVEEAGTLQGALRAMQNLGWSTDTITPLVDRIFLATTPATKA